MLISSRSMLKSGQRSIGLVLSNTVSTASNTSRIIGGLERLEDQNSGIHFTLTMLMERMDQVVWSRRIDPETELMCTIRSHISKQAAENQSRSQNS
jgi:hypothetical protein